MYSPAELVVYGNELAEILESAAGLWRELGNQDKAAAVGRIAGEFAARTRDGDARRERVEDRPREGAEDQPRERAERMTEREMVLQWIDVMKTAMPALREGE